MVPRADGGNEGGEVVVQGMNNRDPAPDDGEEGPVYEDPHADNTNQPHNVANVGLLPNQTTQVSDAAPGPHEQKQPQN